MNFIFLFMLCSAVWMIIYISAFWDLYWMETQLSVIGIERIYL